MITSFPSCGDKSFDSPASISAVSSPGTISNFQTCRFEFRRADPTGLDPPIRDLYITRIDLKFRLKFATIRESILRCARVRISSIVEVIARSRGFVEK